MCSLGGQLGFANTGNGSSFGKGEVPVEVYCTSVTRYQFARSQKKSSKVVSISVAHHFLFAIITAHYCLLFFAGLLSQNTKSSTSAPHCDSSRDHDSVEERN